MALKLLLRVRKTGNRLLEQPVEEADMPHGDFEGLHTGGLQRGNCQRHNLGIRLR
ncbi:hypothetical protein D3C73_1618850 [compost metagenome]